MMNNKKKYLIGGLFSVALLGSCVGYGVYNNQSQKTQPPKIEKKDSHDTKEKKSKSPWENQVQQKEKKTKKQRKTSESTDKILSSGIGNNSKFETNKKTRDQLSNQLTIALDEQKQKENSRSSKNPVLLLSNPSPSKNQDSKDRTA